MEIRHDALVIFALLAVYGIAVADIGGVDAPAPQEASPAYGMKPPPPPPEPGSTRPADLLQEAAVPVQFNVQMYYREHANTWPTSIKQVSHPGEPRQIKSVNLGAAGVLTVTFAANMPDGLGGKSVTLTPSVQADGNLSWKCSAKDVPADDFPSYCR